MLGITESNSIKIGKVGLSQSFKKHKNTPKKNREDMVNVEDFLELKRFN